MRASGLAVTDPDLANVLPALKRAAAAARRLSVETGTPFYVTQDGRVVDLNASRRKPTAKTARRNGRSRVAAR
jgi:hypothetical protein